MFFALDDEQRAFGTAVREYLAERFNLSAVRAAVEDPGGDGHPAALWKAMGEQGWLAVLVPEEHDGLGLGMVEAQVIARSLGAGVAPGPWAPTVLAGEAVRLAGSPAQRAELFPALAAGKLVATVALRGPAARYSLDGVAVRVASDGRLTGVASPVEYPAVAQVVVVAARSEDGSGHGLYLVDPAVPGASVRTLGSYDGTTRLGELTLSDVAAQRLAASGSQSVVALLERAAVLTAADLAGAGREALSRTVAYDKVRVQFGVPVGSFQALKHALADLHVGLTMAEHAVLYAAHALDVGLEDASLAVSVAKAKASDAALAATAGMIQYLGGIGYTWEHEAHVFYKRVKREAGMYGSADEHRERLAALTMGETLGAGA